MMFLPGFVPFYIMQKEVITFCTERLKNLLPFRHAKNFTIGRTKDDSFSRSIFFLIFKTTRISFEKESKLSSHLVLQNSVVVK